MIDPASLTAVNTFLQIVEKVTKLGGQKKKKRRQLFQDIVEPLFIELQPVVDDYFLLFQRAQKLIKTIGQEEMESALSEVAAHRNQLLQARSTVREMAIRLGEEIEDAQIVHFCSDIENFFYFTQYRPGQKKCPGVNI